MILERERKREWIIMKNKSIYGLNQGRSLDLINFYCYCRVGSRVHYNISFIWLSLVFSAWLTTTNNQQQRLIYTTNKSTIYKLKQHHWLSMYYRCAYILFINWTRALFLSVSCVYYTHIYALWRQWLSFFSPICFYICLDLTCRV